MPNLEPINVSLTLSGTYWKDKPKAKVYLDSNLLFDGEISDPIDITWEQELSEGLDKLVIKMYDKDKFQTVLENGEVVKDSLINIEKIIFDGIDIGYLAQSLSTYHPNEQTGVPAVARNCVNLGWNGTWELPFTTPIYIWLLENL